MGWDAPPRPPVEGADDQLAEYLHLEGMGGREGKEAAMFIIIIIEVWSWIWMGAFPY